MISFCSRRVGLTPPTIFDTAPTLPRSGNTACRGPVSTHLKKCTASSMCSTPTTSSTDGREGEEEAHEEGSDELDEEAEACVDAVDPTDPDAVVVVGVLGMLSLGLFLVAFGILSIRFALFLEGDLVLVLSVCEEAAVVRALKSNCSIATDT